LLRCEKLARVRLENHYRRLQPARLRRCTQFVQQRLMAQMHPIEITDGEGNRLGIGRIKSA